MSRGATIARRLLERTGEHPVVTVYLDLDPDRFGTAPARATQARSLLDDAHNLVAADASLAHDAKQGAESDLERLTAYFESDEPPVSDAGALAAFACEQANVFETVVLARSVPGAVFLDRMPHVEPLVTQPDEPAWCTVLVTNRDAEIYLGTGRTVAAHQRSEDYVRGHGASGGSTGHSEEQDAEGHVIQVAEQLHRDWRAARFQALLLGGPVEAASRLEARLHNNLRPTLVGERLELDVSSVSDAELVEAVDARLHDAREQARSHLLADLAEELAAARGRDAPPRAVAGTAAVLEALAEQRVETLLLGRDFHAAGTRCPQCGLLWAAEVSSCPADGTATGPVEDLREPAIHAAVLQDADVIAFSQPVDELPPGREIAAQLRF